METLVLFVSLRVMLGARLRLESDLYLKRETRMALMSSAFPRAAEACMHNEHYSPAAFHSNCLEAKIVLSEVPPLAECCSAVMNPWLDTEWRERWLLRKLFMPQALSSRMNVTRFS